VRAGLLEFNFTFVPATEFIPLVFAARDPAGNLVGGLAGEVMPGWKWLFISLLWVSSSHRRERIGKLNGSWRDTLLFERRSKIVGIA